ncbi:thymidine kinase [Propionispira arboris]|uniref:Thymidine kinase n=1 Tax=Propionispira arboris TaxID=84035 RepID=A0A1H7A1J0_9FIRM|nr:hypothetical protein [Propionispira arboris]SEJ59563.1 thymidine kinase [Propionispira arboris]
MVGWYELIFGSMYCGKSEELIRRLKRCQIASQRYILFKPMMDNRYELSRVMTHENNKVKQFMLKSLAEAKYDVGKGSFFHKIINKIPGSIEAVNINKPEEILTYVSKMQYDVVGIDEVQFFDESLLPILDQLILQGKRIIVAGLDLYASGEPWPIVAKLACKAKYVEKLHAVCVDCGEEAMYSFRLDSNTKDDIVEVGSVGTYIALCENCKQKRLSHI